MIDPIDELKTRARLLHRRLAAGAADAVARLRVLPGFRKLGDAELAARAPEIRLHQCLSVIARELGFAGWPAARAVLGGEWQAQDYGTLLCPTRCAAHFNHWFSDHGAAVACQRERGGTILVYRRHYVVVDRDYLATLGLDPDACEWQQLGRDWSRPRDIEARTRLYGHLIAALPREAA